MRAEARLEFRSLRWVRALPCAFALGCLAGSLALARTLGPSATTWLLAGLAAFFTVAFAESVTTRVILEEDRLVVVSNFRRTVVPRSELVRAVAEKGCPIALERATGGWVRLPGTLAGPHPNTVRAWLKRTEAASSTASATLEEQ